MNNKIFEKLLSIEQQLIESEKPITVDETSEYLGLSKSYIYKLTHLNRIPHFKPMGKKLYFLKSELNKWMLGNRVKTQEELNQIAIDHVMFRRDK